MRDTTWAGTNGGRIAAGVTVLLASMVGLPTAAEAAAPGGPTCMGKPATIVGEPGTNVTGTSGPDVIVGGPGTQRIRPRGGIDLVCAGDGHDGVLDRDHYLDKVDLGARTDSFISMTADARANVDAGNDGEPLDETLWYDGPGISVDLAAGTDSRGNLLRGFLTVHGTPHADTILGRGRTDVILGEGGADLIRGRGGVDYLTTALHADCGPPRSLARLYGGAGNDGVSNAGTCRSQLSGGGGDDRLSSNRGNDLMLGDAGDDYLSAGRGAVQMRGGSGDDLLRVERGTVLVSGGSGFDRWVNWRQVSQNTHRTVVDIGAGTFVDRVVTRDGTDLVTDGRIVGIEYFRGRISQERFIGSAGVDRINAGGTRGNKVDRISGRGGNDRLVAPRHGWIDGGVGSDYCRAEQKRDCER
jgi:Ca2+-binding RTX toxin-like protein